MPTRKSKKEGIEPNMSVDLSREEKTKPSGGRHAAVDAAQQKIQRGEKWVKRKKLSTKTVYENLL